MCPVEKVLNELYWQFRGMIAGMDEVSHAYAQASLHVMIAERKHFASCPACQNYERQLLELDEVA